MSQTLGMGALTGGLVRWRLAPGLSLIGAMRVSISVALSFLAGWAVISAVALLVVPLPLPGARAGAVGVLALAGLAALASVLQPRLPRGLHMPPLKAMAVILGLAALDTPAAGTVLWVLLPPELATTPARVIAAYLLGLGAGLVLTTPGGVGPFEVTLLALLPDLPTEPLLATIIAYRALYYAGPAMLAGAILLRGTLPARAEAGLLRHGHLGLLTDSVGRPLSATTTSGQSLILLGDPLRRDGAPGAVLDRACQAAGAHGLRQFKATFAPHWEPLYLAAPNRAGLVLGALDIPREIVRPRPHGS